MPVCKWYIRGKHCKFNSQCKYEHPFGPIPNPYKAKAMRSIANKDMIKDILSKAQLKDQLLASVVAEAEAEAETTCNADVNKTPEGDDTRLEETIIENPIKPHHEQKLVDLTAESTIDPTPIQIEPVQANRMKRKFEDVAAQMEAYQLLFQRRKRVSCEEWGIGITLKEGEFPKSGREGKV